MYFIYWANVVGALPSGRRLGDALYNGGVSPGPGLDKKGPTAVLKSCAKIDHVSDLMPSLLNQRLSPTQLAGEKGCQLWKSYMKTWADLGIDHVQFNMVDDATLEAAQRDPGKYQEVIVVSGARHSHEGGNPVFLATSALLDSRFRGNDGHICDIT